MIPCMYGTCNKSWPRTFLDPNYHLDIYYCFFSKIFVPKYNHSLKPIVPQFWIVPQKSSPKTKFLYHSLNGPDQISYQVVKKTTNTCNTFTIECASNYSYYSVLSHNYSYMAFLVEVKTRMCTYTITHSKTLSREYVFQKRNRLLHKNPIFRLRKSIKTCQICLSLFLK